MRTILLPVLDPLRRVIEGRLVGSRGTYLLGFIVILQEGLILLILQLGPTIRLVAWSVAGTALSIIATWVAGGF